MFELTNRDLADLLDAVTQSDITYFHLKTAEFEVSISRGDEPADASGSEGVPGPTVARPAEQREDVPAAPTPEPSAAPALAPAQAAPRTTRVDDSRSDSGQSIAVTAPMVGAFYAAPEPGAAPYVQPGDVVDADTTVGLIEAMKVFTAVTAGVRGVVATVLVSNGDFVEYGQNLLEIVPSPVEPSVQGDVATA